MATSSLKQRELREREDLFLEIAHELLRTRGFHGLTMDRIAAEVAYLEGEGRETFERPYGLAWLLQLCAELREWDDPEARGWRREPPVVALMVIVPVRWGRVPLPNFRPNQSSCRCWR